MNWYTKSIKEVAREFKTDIKNGIKSEQVEERILTYGKNKLSEKKKTSFIVHFFQQFNDFMVIILIIAAVVSFCVSYFQHENDFIDPIIILVIVILNAVLGLIQENKAEKALEALKNMSAPTAKAIRNGQVVHVNTEELVPGDLIMFETGDYISADARIVSAVNLKIEESALTGESVPSTKEEDIQLNDNVSIGDRLNMVFAGSSVSIGRGTAVVVGTGMNTEMGKIASMIISDEAPQTPLQRKLGETGKMLGIGALCICLAIFLMGILRKVPAFEMFMTSVSLAVAAIPEGLPAIVTIMLAIGVQRMARRNAVIRKLPAVETLGSASVICSDKTGTLTQNKMKVVEISDGFSIMERTDENKKFILKLSILCNDSILESGREQKILGEPTETALVTSALQYGINKNTISEDMKRIAEIPFDSKRKLMTTLHKSDIGGYLSVTKGAPDVLIEKCKYYYENGKKKELTFQKKKEILLNNTRMAEKALRILAVGFKEMNVKPSKLESSNAENEIIFAGLIGMMDPPREEVKEAVEICKKAGIKPVMITGDHIYTAKAIAKKIGIMEQGDKAMTGEELDKIGQDELSKNIFDYSVFARVSPEHKVRIVKAFKSKGAVVAMTGDGVNDAPALKAADIGCAMGINGTDVAKGAADMILTDDNFATIVEAIREGRGIFSNIKKAVHFLLSSNIGEIITIFAAMLIGFRTPLLAIQLLWVNLVTDSLPAIALGLDPASDDIMENKPYKNQKSLFSNGLWLRIGLEGIMIGMLALVAFGIGCVFFDKNDSVIIGRTMAFATLSISQLVHAFNMRSEHSIFSVDLFSNVYLIGSLVIGIILQAGVIMIEPIANVFKVVPLSPVNWLIVIILCLMPIVIVEFEKMARKEEKKQIKKQKYINAFQK